MRLRGRIDRIDVNERSGDFVILDYKSGDEGRSPQGSSSALPCPSGCGGLARFATAAVSEAGRSSGISTPATKLGFVAFQRSVKQTGFQLADWTDAELLLAEAAAERVVQSIRQGIYWPPNDPSPLFSESLDRICQSHVFGRSLGEVELAS